jgi:predicted 3-demethylubiquinone-9 3-methyltransferase (glyoxalase superfamily)
MAASPAASEWSTFSTATEGSALAGREKLGAGGEYGRCGWLKDRYGLSWQIVPSRLPELLSGPDAAGAKLAMEAMLQMTKLDIARLDAAYDGS